MVLTSSFVNNLLNPEVSPDDLAEDPVKSVKKKLLINFNMKKS